MTRDFPTNFTPLDAACTYLNRGFQPVPVQWREKACRLKGWGNLRTTVEDLPQHFKSTQLNIGLLLGEPSDGLCDVDLDAREAIVLAENFLPVTGAVFGRESKPRSHWLYIVTSVLKTAKFQDVDGTVIVELRSTGCQTMVPPSTHPSGERVEWANGFFGDPAQIDSEELRTRVARLAVACLIVRHWPKGSGSRQHIALALSGSLLQAGWEVDEVSEFILAVATVAGDEETQQRAKTAEYTAIRQASDLPATGWPTLAEFLGEPVVKKLRDWLGIRGPLRPKTNGNVPYVALPSGLVYLKPTTEGPIQVPLTNFTATITADVSEDDGAEVRRLFEIEAKIGGYGHRFTVPSERYNGMTWVPENLGAKAIVFPGMSIKDHARVAIQFLSGDIPELHVYSHTGWRQIDGEWVYLHTGGALGSSGPVPGVAVAVPATLTGYNLPTPPGGKDLVRAVRASLKLLTVAPEYITFPIFAVIWRAVFGGVDFSLHVSGPTGAGKSELTALAQQHFGSGLDARHLPGSWSSTGNALEGLAFHAKDVLLAVDDFAPTGSSNDVQRFHREADRLLRAQGNSAGRQRMRADATLRPPKPPRGLILSTGEDIPRGQSLRARLLILELGPSDMNWSRLTGCQTDAASGLYAGALSGFIEWIAPNFGYWRTWIRRKALLYRQRYVRASPHPRTPGIVGELTAGLELFLIYAVEAGVLTRSKALQLLSLGWNALKKAALAQSRYQEAGEPTRRFLELLGSAINAGNGYVARPNGDPPPKPQAWGWRRDNTGWRPNGKQVGWLCDEELFLEPDTAYAVAQDLGRSVGDQLTVTPQTLRKRLMERGLLVSTDQNRETLTIRKKFQGRQRNVLHLLASSLSMGKQPDKPDKKRDRTA